MAFRDNGTLITTATRQDVTADGLNGTFFAADGANAFVIENGNVGDDTFLGWGSNDSLINTRAIFDGNGDGFIQFGGNGVLDIDRDDGKLVKVKGVVEKPQPKDAPSTLTIIGRYVLEPEVFDHLTQIGRGAGGEIQLTDGLARLIAAKRPFFGLRFEGKRFDCGDKIGFFEANLAFALARPDMRDSIQRILSRYR